MNSGGKKHKGISNNFLHSQEWAQSSRGANPQQPTPKSVELFVYDRSGEVFAPQVPQPHLNFPCPDAIPCDG